MPRKNARWTRALLTLVAATLLCLAAAGCESWFRSETATPLPPIEQTAEPTEQAPPDEEPTATAVPATPEAPIQDDYPYPVELPGSEDLPAYPEAYPGE